MEFCLEKTTFSLFSKALFEWHSTAGQQCFSIWEYQLKQLQLNWFVWAPYYPKESLSISVGDNSHNMQRQAVQSGLWYLSHMLWRDRIHKRAGNWAGLGGTAVDDSYVWMFVSVVIFPIWRKKRFQKDHYLEHNIFLLHLWDLHCFVWLKKI